MDAKTWELIELRLVYPNALPFAGGLRDQPAEYVLAMRVLDRSEAAMSREHEKLERMRRRQQGG